MKGHRRSIAIIAAILVAALAGCRGPVQGIDVGGLYREARELVARTLSRTRGDEGGVLSASGTIEADEIRIAGELGGRITAVAVGPGDLVRANQVLVRLDDTPLQSRLFEAEAAVAVAEAQLAEARAGPGAHEVAAAEALLALAQAQRDGYRAAWENALEALENPQELDAQIAQARTQVKLAEQGAILAEAQLAREQLIRDQKAVGTVERDIAEWQVVAAEERLAERQADLETARALLNGLWAIRAEPLALTVQAHVAEGQYYVAEGGVAVAQAQLDDLEAGPTRDEVRVAEARAWLELARAEAIRAQREQFVLTSPIDGVVLDQALRAGELAAPAATVLTVANLDRLTLTVYVPVNQVGGVQLGQQVQVTVGSLPGQVFAGQVERIGDEPEYTPRNIATREERLNTFYAVEVRVDNAEGLLKPGMPADATF